MKTNKIQIPIYYGTLIIVLVEDWRVFYNKFNITPFKFDYEGFFVNLEDKDEYIIALKSKKWSVISHEVVHAVNSIFKSCNVKLDIDNDEPQAYLTGWIIEQIDNFINKP